MVERQPTVVSVFDMWLKDNQLLLVYSYVVRMRYVVERQPTVVSVFDMWLKDNQLLLLYSICG